MFLGLLICCFDFDYLCLIVYCLFGLGFAFGGYAVWFLEFVGVNIALVVNVLVLCFWGSVTCWLFCVVGLILLYFGILAVVF